MAVVKTKLELSAAEFKATEHAMRARASVHRRQRVSAL
jgi:hypothetical protein